MLYRWVFLLVVANQNTNKCVTPKQLIRYIYIYIYIYIFIYMYVCMYVYTQYWLVTSYYSNGLYLIYDWIERNNWVTNQWLQNNHWVVESNLYFAKIKSLNLICCQRSRIAFLCFTMPCEWFKDLHHFLSYPDLQLRLIATWLLSS